MRRLAAIALVVAAAVVVVVVAVVLTRSDDDDVYRVRAIFDSAFSVIEGEDVKVAGVKVGKIESLHVTPDKKAAIVLRIDKPGFGDFRQDASCIIRPQSLIGEKFVECTPTQPRDPGQEPPPPLERIKSGEGKGQYLLPVSNTMRNVDLDLINNIYQLPERQRLTIILNELGAGLAGRGEDLNQVIRRANPALMETDKVLAILRQQNQVLADLARDSDTVLGPLANRRTQVADFIEKARDVSQATAERRGALEDNFARLPRFLEELRPTLVRLGALSDEMTPVLEDLGAQAPNINRFIENLGPLSQAARPAVRSLGDAAVVGTDAMRDIRPITQDINNLASSSAPLARDLNELLVSLRDTGGIERAMDYLFFQMTAINGFDASGHYLRAGLIINACATYAVEPTIGCLAKFGQGGGQARAAGNGGAGRSLYLKRQDALLRGMPIDEVLRRYPDPDEADHSARRDRSDDEATTVPVSNRGGGGSDAPIRMPDAVLPSSGSAPKPDPAPAPSAPAQSAAAPPAGSQPAPSGAPAPAPSSEQPAASATTQLLDYLLGGGG